MNTSSGGAGGSTLSGGAGNQSSTSGADSVTGDLYETAADAMAGALDKTSIDRPWEPEFGAFTLRPTVPAMETILREPPRKASR